MKLRHLLGLILISYLVINNHSSYSLPKIAGNADTLKAQIDITIVSGGTERYAKPFDRVKSGEKFHIHIKPENKNYLCIINVSDGKPKVVIDTLLKDLNFYVFPSNKSFFIFDGKNDTEKIIVVLSFTKEPLNKIKSLVDNDLLAYIQKLNEASKCNISEKGDALINITGNLRDISADEQRMTKYQGIKHLIKEFKFNVKR